MWFSKKADASIALATPTIPIKQAGDAVASASQITTKRRGDAAEDVALAYLTKAGLKLVDRNYRTPGRGGGEIDLVMRAADGTLVFVEVRQRSSTSHGGAGASIGAVKRQRIVFAARHYLARLRSHPPCRFDVVLVQGKADAGGQSVEWLVAAFDAS